jgi:hypothetical protein
MKLKLFSTILILIILISLCIGCYPKTLVKEEKSTDVSSLKFSILYNENLFTISCIFYLTGPDDEEILSDWENHSSKKGMQEFKKNFPECFEYFNNPLRKKIKDDLNKIDPKIFDKITSEPKLRTYNSLSIKMGLMEDAIKLSKDEFLNKYELKEFYEEAKIHNLYLKYEDDFEEILEEYKKTFPEVIKDIRDYLRLEEPEENEIIYVMNFLDINFGAYCSRGLDKIYICSKFDPYYTALTHEYIHPVIEPLFSTYENYKLFNKYKELMQLLRDKGMDRAYNTWTMIVNESLVQSIAFRILFSDDEEKLNFKIRENEKVGLILVRHFNEKLKEYEKKDIKFEDFLPEMLSTIDIEKEKEEFLRDNK